VLNGAMTEKYLEEYIEEYLDDYLMVMSESLNPG
jgi:hypothetical protein